MVHQDSEAMEARSGSSNSRKRSHSDAAALISNSSSSNTNDASTAISDNSSNDNNNNAQLPSPAETPKRSKKQKRVRFTDPGPSVLNETAFSAETGLTPAMNRTSFNIAAATTDQSQDQEQDQEPQTPSSRKRRRSAPLPTLPDLLIDPVIPSPIKVQFSPLKQILDPRTRRQLWRSGLSEEMNAIEREKKEKAKEEKKSMKEAKEQIEALKRELESYKSAQADALEEEARDLSNNFEDTIPLDDETMDDSVLLSDSPGFNRYHDVQTSDGFESSEFASPRIPTADSAVQVDILNDQAEEEIQTLTDVLDVIRQERQDLFNELKRLNPAQNESESPPPDFMKQIVPTLEAAILRASDSHQALEVARSELANMGFSGASIDETLSQMRESIRSARMELESMLPGETPAGLTDGKSTFEALVKRLKQSFNALLSERTRAKSLHDSQTALKKQFDQTLLKLEAERVKSKKYEEFSEASAEDMLHIRMRLQELETEVADKATLIERFNRALKQYHEEGKRFEVIIEQLEDEKRVDGEVSAARIAELEDQVSRKSSIVSVQEKENSELAESVKDKEVHINDLVSRVHLLETENDRLVDELANQEVEIGKLNVRYSQESTNLQCTKLDLEKVQRINQILNWQQKKEAKHRERLEQWLEEGKKVLGADNWASQTGGALLSDNLNSEPSLPANSPSKAVRGSLLGNVRLGRGKDRRTLAANHLESDVLVHDSGIGLSTDNVPSGQTAAGMSDVDNDPMDEYMVFD